MTERALGPRSLLQYYEIGECCVTVEFMFNARGDAAQRIGVAETGGTEEKKLIIGIQGCQSIP